MTSHRTTGSPAGSACPDLDTLADLHADVLDATTASALRDHVSDCSRCQETLAALDATVATLSSLPPVTMPAHLAARLDRALAEESGRVVPLQPAAPTTGATPVTGATPARPTTGPQTGAVPAGSNVVDFGAARERRRGGAGRWLLAAAAAAAVVTGAVIVINQDSSTTGDGTHVAASQTAQSEAAGDPAQGGATRALQGSTPSEVLENSPIVAGSANAQLAGEMAEATARNKCLAAIPGRPVTAPEAVQMGMYDGTEAYGFVFPVDQSTNEIVMYVVEAADCSTVIDIVEGTR